MLPATGDLKVTQDPLVCQERRADQVFLDWTVFLVTAANLDTLALWDQSVSQAPKESRVRQGSPGRLVRLDLLDLLATLVRQDLAERTDWMGLQDLWDRLVCLVLWDTLVKLVHRASVEPMVCLDCLVVLD